jgi:hypothetical protein
MQESASAEILGQMQLTDGAGDVTREHVRDRAPVVLASVQGAEMTKASAGLVEADVWMPGNAQARASGRRRRRRPPPSREGTGER